MASVRTLHNEHHAVVPAAGGKARAIEKLPAEFPMNAHVVPQIVHTKAADGVDISNELWVPADLKPDEKRPAIIFVHGGAQRQMLPGYHYMQFYHEAYAVNQWLASQGYVVMSINYRTGIGYGNSFRAAKNSGGRGNSEYLDVLAGGKYLQSRDDVDPTRIGIWGLSYGGDLASQALARNSDMFVAGADMAGVHLWGNSLNPQDLSFQSSTISAIDKWKSPVFLVQGDDDRNVAFTQMMGLVHLLRQRNVYYDLTIIPDDLHETMIHARWVDVWARMGEFLHDYVWDRRRLHRRQRQSRGRCRGSADSRTRREGPPKKRPLERHSLIPRLRVRTAVYAPDSGTAAHWMMRLGLSTHTAHLAVRQLVGIDRKRTPT